MKTISNLITYLRPLLYAISLLIACQITAQEKFIEYSGKVVDVKSNRPLDAVSLKVSNTNIGTVTNDEGDFVLKIPNAYLGNELRVSLLGYTPYVVNLSQLSPKNSRIKLEQVVTQLSEVSISAFRDARILVEKVFRNKMANVENRSVTMTAFYRETIKRRSRNVSLTEAVVNIHKKPYNGASKDAIGLSRARKSTDYKRLDTLSVKLQGGPFSTIYLDVMKYPEYIFNENFGNYSFTFAQPSTINNRDVYVVKFEPINKTLNIIYRGELYIDVESLALVSADYSLDLVNKRRTKNLLVRKKPSDVIVYPLEANYKVDYQLKGDKWYFGYSNLFLKFKVNKKKSLFNKVYTMSSEMAVTDWEFDSEQKRIPRTNRLKPSVIIADAISGFSDPDFWGAYNLIEPDKSIESAIKKIQKSIEREKAKSKEDETKRSKP